MQAQDHAEDSQATEQLLLVRVSELEAQVERQAELLSLVPEPDKFGKRIELQREVEDLQKQLKQIRRQKKKATRRANDAEGEIRVLLEWRAEARSVLEKLLGDDSIDQQKMRDALMELLSRR